MFKRQNRRNAELKFLKGMQTNAGKEAESHLIEGEILWSIYGLKSDYSCITDYRVFFTDKNVSGNKRIISIPFNHIIELSYEYDRLFIEIYINTASTSHILKMEEKSGVRFVKDIIKHTTKHNTFSY